ncbi:MAG: glycosyltransferase, partial [Chthoniobacterales bacterium]
ATNGSVAETVKKRGKKPDSDVFIVRTSPKAIKAQIKADSSLKRGKSYLVGYIGVMGNADGVDFLIDAAKVLVKDRNRHDIQFLIMGTGPEYASLVSKRDQYGLEDFVDMPGRVSEDLLARGLQTMDIGIGCDPINPYNDHCTMNKTLEYMAFSKPQVMFGIHEGRLSAGDAALYIMENSSEKLADGIEALLADPIQRQQMGKLGFERLNEDLSWEKSTQHLVAAYNRIRNK